MKNIFIKIIIVVFVFLIGISNVLAASVVKKTYQVPVLVYHSLGFKPVKKESSGQLHYRVLPNVFEAQMKYLRDNGYSPINFATYVDSFKNNTKLPDKAVVITFDDGWKNQYTYAVPILEKYKFTATFFIISDSMSRPYMNTTELKDLINKGFEIGSHTESHPILTKLNTTKLKKELEGSKKTLEDKLNIKVKTLAYPNYMQNAIVRNVIEKAGYSGARAGWAKFNNSKEYIYQLKSQEVVNNPNPFSSKRLADLP